MPEKSVLRKVSRQYIPTNWPKNIQNENFSKQHMISSEFNTGLFCLLFISIFSYVSGKFPVIILGMNQFCRPLFPRKTIGASPGDRTHAREVIGLEVIDSNHSPSKTVTELVHYIHTT